MNQQQGATVESMLDELGQDLTQAYGDIIARQGRDLVVARTHIANLQARLRQAEAALVEMQSTAADNTE